MWRDGRRPKTLQGSTSPHPLNRDSRCRRQSGSCASADVGRWLVLGPRRELPRKRDDCLFLNVWPPSLDTAKRPIMACLHYDGFPQGSVSPDLTDGGNLARTQGLVVITLNHRLNLLGFIDLARLSDEFPNAGIRDRSTSCSHFDVCERRSQNSAAILEERQSLANPAGA